MKKATSLPISLRRPSIHISPTFYGFLFMGVLVVMLIGSINYNNNLGFVLVFMLGGMGLISMVHTYRNLSGLTILSISAAPVFAGDASIFNLMVRSGTAHRTAVAIAVQKSKNVVTDIPVGTDLRIDLEIATQTRGLLQAGPLKIESLFPLGLFRVWAVLELDAQCCVYPKPLSGPRIQAEGLGNISANGKNKDGGADDFAGLRTYQAGDPIRHIAWKSLARGLGLFSKDFETEGRGSVVFDYNKIKADDPEIKLSFICSMILAVQRANIKYGLQLPGKSIPPDNGDRHRHRCLKALALFGNREL